MAITDPAAIKFCNEEVRVLADRMMQLYYHTVIALDDFTSKGLGSLIPNDSTVVVDGAATDGRTQITGFDVNVVLSWAGAFKQTMEANTNLAKNQVGKVAVNPLS